jgi:N6-L-threonylcarbamoyladenine synthase
VELIIPVIDQALQESGVKKENLSSVAVTYGPGLVGALLVGLTAAKALSFALKKPLIGVHHIEGHIAANYITHPQLEPPFICLVASGGHSHVVIVRDYERFEIIGKTRDDAAGEAFDKVARCLGLGYPGGPLIDKLSKVGNSKAIQFPKTYFGEGVFDFSFSGIKTSVINYINNAKNRKQEIIIEDVAASFQEAVTDVLTTNLINAAIYHGIQTVALAGGVAANTALRERIKNVAEAKKIKFYYPDLILCTDNAAMIAVAGFYEYKKGNYSRLYLNAVPNLKLGEHYTCL